MDLHDVGRGRGGVEAALQRIIAPVLTIGIDSDILYPAYQQQIIHSHITHRDARNQYVELHSDEGHDGFLIETVTVGREISRFLSSLDA
jgi:homoserine O-acetyltransferase